MSEPLVYVKIALPVHVPEQVGGLVISEYTVFTDFLIFFLTFFLCLCLPLPVNTVLITVFVVVVVTVCAA